MTIKDLKNTISLEDIQKQYFELVESEFKKYNTFMLKNSLTPSETGDYFSSQENELKLIINSYQEFMEVIGEFWSKYSAITISHLSALEQVLLGSFSGDFFPTYKENIVSKCGIYTDTIILPDPFIRTKEYFSYKNEVDKAYYYIMYALNLLQYKKLAYANIKIPIVLIIPDKNFSASKERFHSSGKEYTLRHSSKIFGRNFGSFEEFVDFTNYLDTKEKFISEVHDGKRVIFDIELSGGLEAQIDHSLDGELANLVGSNHLGLIFRTHLFGRMIATNKLITESREINATPIIDAPTSWKYINWKFEYDAVDIEKLTGLEKLHTLRGIQTVSEHEMQWLGNVPLESLIEIRESGAIDDIRYILSNGINEIAKINATNFYRTSDRVFDNINTAFIAHEKKIQELTQKKWKFAGKDIGSWLVFGAVEIAALAYSSPELGIAGFVANQVLDIPKLKELPTIAKDIRGENKALDKSATGILYSLSKIKV